MVKHKLQSPQSGAFVLNTTGKWTPEQIAEAKRKAEEDRWKNKPKKCNCK